jgi:tRNA(Ser,Leu) C12 N-acetylase TAN1
MEDWNVVVTLREGSFADTCRSLEELGEVARTDYYNVLAMKVEDVAAFPAAMQELARVVPALEDSVARAVPSTHVFLFQSPDELEARAKKVVASWLPELAGKSFHVRMHRRGFKGRISSQHEEQFLDEFLLTALDEQGAPGRINFDDPDVIIDLETIGQRAGLSLWTRAQRRRYPLLKLD